tara:strand:+ start:7706 stop:9436 length:1731 start_codon:yes stop_codon:yes gene_type:complete
MKKALVTGASGFLGTHLVKRLEKEKIQVFISNTKTANLLDYDNLKIFDGVKFDYIFHLAVVQKAGDWSLTHTGDQWYYNQIMNSNILRYWKDKQPQAKFINMGTSCSYSPNTPMKENNYLLGEPESSLYTYAMIKRLMQIGLQSFGDQYGLKWLCFIPSTLYGNEFHERDNHFIFDFIKNCYQAKHNNKKFTIWGDGTVRRELIHVDDACNAIVNLLDHDNEIFNLGSGQDYTINEFAEYVCDSFDYDYNKIERDLSKYVGVKEKSLDITKVSKYYKDNYIKIPPKDGIKLVTNWYINKKKKTDKSKIELNKLLGTKLDNNSKFIIPDNINSIKIDVGLAGEAPNSAIWLDETTDRFVIGIEPLPYHWGMIKDLKTSNSKREYPKDFKFLQLNKGIIELNGQEISKIGDRFCGIECAIDNIGDNVEFAEFYEMDRTDGASGSSSLLKPSTHHPHFIQNIVKTPVISLKSILDCIDWERFPYIEHIKTDCEGKDFDVVKSIGKYLPNILYITSEMTSNIHHWQNSCNPQEFINFMIDNGFSCYHTGTDLICINDKLEAKHHSDITQGLLLNYKTLGY